VITFLSDYGLEDDFVGVCHGVMAMLCPRARVIHVTHGIARHDIRAGALILEAALPYLPVGVHLAVVDPGVGAERRAVALALADGRLLVGPDNGLLWLAAERAGVREAVDIAHSQFRLERVSSTFHGRDVFAPVAARLADGVALADAGEPFDPDRLVRLELPRPTVRRGEVVAHAVHIDRFGNVQLNVTHEHLPQLQLEHGQSVTLHAQAGKPQVARYVHTFADVAKDQLILYEDSYERLAVAANRGNAAAQLGLSVDDELRITAQ
jgi:S-adenosylmethionine hydrolase